MKVELFTNAKGGGELSYIYFINNKTNNIPIQLWYDSTDLLSLLVYTEDNSTLMLLFCPLQNGLEANQKNDKSKLITFS